MSNPYSAPQAGSTTFDAKRHANDTKLRQLRFRLRVCGIVLGLALFPLGLALLYVSNATAHVGETMVLLAVGATLTVVGAFACQGRSWPAYLTAMFAVLWLGFLAISPPSVFIAAEPDRYPAVLILRILRATPAILLLTPAALLFLVAAAGIWLDRLIRLRSVELAFTSHETPNVEI